MIKILLIRHALTDSVGKRLSGRSQGLHLNAQGQRQAEKLAEQLLAMQIDAIYSSPLERALETAATIAQSHHLTCYTSDDFIEIDFGAWTNRTIEELTPDPIFKRFNTFRSCTRIPGGELTSEAQIRMVKGLEKLHHLHPNKSVAVISHADTIKAAIAHYAGIHLDMFHRIEISPASLSILELYDNDARILQLNETFE